VICGLFSARHPAQQQSPRAKRYNEFRKIPA
jgi:hypothetical protein